MALQIASKPEEKNGRVMFYHYLKLSVRSLRRNPVLTFLMIASVAFGVSASMTSFAVFRAASGDPIPWKSSQLYFPQIDSWGSTSGNGKDEPNDAMTYLDAEQLLRDGRAPKQTALYQFRVTITPMDATQHPWAVPGHAVSGDFFSIVDAAFRYGGRWSSKEEQDHANVVVIDSDLNRRLFGDKSGVGQSLQLDQRSYRIVGVLDHWHPQPQFYDLANSNAFGPADQVFMPFATSIDQGIFPAGSLRCPATAGRRAPGFAGILNSNCIWIGYMVELDSTTERDQYLSYLDNYAREQQRSGRFGWAPNNRLRNLKQWLEYEQVAPSDIKISLAVAFGLLVACMVNTVGLLLAKFMRKAPEIGVRRALGASKQEIVVQFLTESGGIGVAGGALGGLMTWGGVIIMRSILDPDITALVNVDLPLLVGTVLLAVAVTLLAGLFPAWRATQINPALQLKGS